MFKRIINRKFINEIMLFFSKKKNPIFAILLFNFFLTSFSTLSQTVYLDDFNTVSYSNNCITPGCLPFATNWVEVNDGANNPTTGRIQIVSNQLRFDNLDNRSISRGVDLSALSSVLLTFDYNATGRGNEALLAQLWNSTASAWETIATLNNSVTGSISYTLNPNQISATSAIRFNSGSGNWSSGETIFIDNVKFLQLITDSDGDLIGNNIDLDDDNDGITDAQELCGTDFFIGGGSAVISIIIDLDKYEGETSWTLQDPTSSIIGSGGPYLDGDEIIGQNFTVSTGGNYIFTIKDSFADGLSGGGSLDSDSNGTAGYSIALDGANIFTSSNYPNFGLESSHAIPVPFGCLLTDPNNDDDNDGTINYKDPDYAAANGSVLNANGVVSSLDSDGDGVIDSMDLDSDNDGIYDIIEGGALNVVGVVDADLDGRIDGATVPVAVGANGVYDTVETVAESGVLNYTVSDSDLNGTRDVVQLDADSDGCNDVTEAGFTDNNFNGLLGPLPITINIDGLVTSGSDGYTTPADGDLNLIFDFQEVGVFNSITTQPTDQIICAGANGSFTVVASGSNLTYQWQLSTDGGATFSNLIDSGVYTGSNTATLNITGATEAMDAYQYQVIVGSSVSFCFVTSSTATLSVPDVSYTATGNPTCSGPNGVITLSGLSSSTIYAISFTDDGVPIPPANYTSDGSGEILLTGLDAGNYTNIVATLQGCSGAPLSVTILDGIIPSAPVSGGDQTECEASPLQTLTATATAPAGSSVVWYDAASGGSIVGSPTLNAIGSITYYAESVENTTGCLSSTRTAVTLSIYDCSVAIMKSQIGGPNPVTAAGQTLDYEIVVANTGAVNLTGVSITDILPDGSSGTLSAVVESITPDGILEVSETWTYTISYTTTATDEFAGVDLVNTASVVTNEIPGPTTDTAVTPLYDEPPIITAVGSQVICPGQGNTIPVATSVSITDPDDTTLDFAYIQISSGYVIGEDLLALSGSHPNITTSWDPVQGELSLIGPATLAEFEAAILDVLYSSSSASATGLRNFSISIGSANYLPSTGHYYEYVPNYGITWTAAEALANTRTYFGLQGYLATLTTQSEADFSGTQAVGVGWIGASDAAVEGNWEWVTGPEAGNALVFTFWNTGEPNNAGNEDYAHITSPSVGIIGSWNDLANGGSTCCGDDYFPQGYVVEYGGMPGDPILNITAVTDVTLETPAAPTSGGDQIQCEDNPIQTLTATASAPSGSSVVWYDAASGGSVVASPILNAVGTITYYAESYNSTTNCTSLTRTAVSLTIYATPTAPVSGGDQTECEASPLQTLTATATAPAGSSVVWYDAASGGSVVASPTLNAVGSVTYYAESLDGSSSCTSLTRTAVSLTIEAAPTAPTGVSPQNFCATDGATVSDLVATGSNIQWYAAATGGVPLGGATVLVNGTTYYASQTVAGCESLIRLAVTVNLEQALDPGTNGTLTICEGETVTAAELFTSLGGTPDAGGVWSPALAGADTYTYTHAATGDCPAVSAQVVVSEQAASSAPISGGDQIECALSPVQTLTATATAPAGSSVVWYDAMVGGNVVANPDLNVVGTIIYYAESVEGSLGCVSNSRTAVTLTIETCSLTIVKSNTITDPDGSGDVSVGDVVTYTFTLNNNGTAILTGVTVVDDILGAAVLSDVAGDGVGVLAPGATETATLTYTILAGDLGTTITNIATGDSDQTTPVTDTNSIVVESPSISIVKVQTGGNNPVTGVNDVLGYTITVVNTGSANLTNVVVVDTLPDGSAGVLAGPVGDTNGNSILDTSETWTYTISYTVTQTDIDAGLDLTNTASVTTNEIVVAESDTAITPINAVSSMVVTKTQVGGPNPVTAAGQTLDYEITVENTGAVSLTGVTSVDTLPDGSAGVLAGPTSDIGILGTIDVGEIWTYTISYNATLADMISGADLINSASVTTNEVVIAESDTAVTTVATSDLEISKIVDNATPNVGDNIVFTISVTNVGPSDATGVTVTDLIPNGYTYVSDDGAGAYVSGTGIWTVPAMTNGNTELLNITASVNAAGDYINIAEISTADLTDPDSTPGNGVTTEDDYSSIGITPSAVSDLLMTKSVDNATPNVGTNIVFTLEVSNGGPSDVTGVEVTDLLPTGYTYVSDDGAGAYVSGTGVWTVPAITNGNTAILNITASVNATGVYTNIAEVTASDNFDPDSTPANGVTTEDDYDSIATVPIAVSDIELAKVVDNATPLVGSSVVFTLTVTNNGPSDGTGVLVTDLLPTGYTYISDDGAGAYVSGTGLWTVPTITIGNTAILNITASVNATGVYTNIAEVTASTNLDPDSTPNDGVTTDDDYDSINTTPISVSDVELIKVVDNATPLVGSNVIFTLVVTNNGPSDATGVVVTDLLPTGYTYVSDDVAGAYISATGLWTVPTITNGNTATLNITASVKYRPRFNSGKRNNNRR